MIKWVLRGFQLVLALSLVMLVGRSLRVWGGSQAYQEAAAVGRASPAPSQSPSPAVSPPPAPATAPPAEAASPAASPAPSPTPQPEPTEEPEPLSDEEAALLGIDLAALQAVNPDVIGWIEIPGTVVSYPLVQGEDNHYYLDYNWKKEPSVNGAVFLESTNRRDLSNYNTIVYAHRMLDDSMFGSLRHYAELDYWREHPSVYLLTPEGLRRYDIFAAHEAGVTSLVYRLDLEESRLEQDFLDYCLGNSVIDTGIAPQADEQILTLSTCAEYGYATRWVLQAVLGAEWPAE